MPSAGTPSVLLFIDNSNIFISAQNVAARREGLDARLAVRLAFENIVTLAANGRPVAGIFVVGSVPPEERDIWLRMESIYGVKPELYERGSDSNKEQGLDQCLQVHMLRASTDFPEPQIAVLMSGDGAGYDDRKGFHADLERLHQAGWGIEVMNWKVSCGVTLRNWATRNGVYIDLEDHYESVTFLNRFEERRGRRVAPLSLKQRPMATTRLSPSQLAIKAQADAAKNEIAAMKAQLEEQAKLMKSKARNTAHYMKRQKNRQKGI